MLITEGLLKTTLLFGNDTSVDHDRGWYEPDQYPQVTQRDTEPNEKMYKFTVLHPNSQLFPHETLRPELRWFPAAEEPGFGGRAVAALCGVALVRNRAAFRKVPTP